MVTEWRRQWSFVNGTTSGDVPFGVVTLAAGGSEGHDENMAGMRWSQTVSGTVFEGRCTTHQDTCPSTGFCA